MLSVLIVEDQRESQAYLDLTINCEGEFKNLGIAGTGREAIKMVKQWKPDIVLMDIGLPDMNGIECLVQLKQLFPDIRFIVCTVFEEDEQIFEAMKAGADGYILKKSKPYQIIDAIKDVSKGDFPVTASIARKLLNSLQPHKPHAEKETYSITARENEVLKMLAKGLSYQEIADAIFISIKTLKWHIFNIYKKLQADNRTEALNKYFGNNNS